jgi:hypothetical protein
MEPLWSPAVATGGNPWQMRTPGKRLKEAKTVAVGCDQLPEVFMVRVASATACHRLRTPPLCEGGGRFPRSAKRQVLRTRRPTGLDRATLTGERGLVKRNRARPWTNATAMLGAPGTYSPAGAEAAKSGANPALSRNCDAPARGRVRSTLLRRNERQPSEEGRFGRRRPPGLLLRRRGGFCERTNDRLEARAFAASRRDRRA